MILHPCLPLNQITYVSPSYAVCTQAYTMTKKPGVDLFERALLLHSHENRTTTPG